MLWSCTVSVATTQSKDLMSEDALEILQLQRSDTVNTIEQVCSGFQRVDITLIYCEAATQYNKAR